MSFWGVKWLLLLGGEKVTVMELLHIILNKYVFDIHR